MQAVGAGGKGRGKATQTNVSCVHVSYYHTYHAIVQDPDMIRYIYDTFNAYDIMVTMYFYYLISKSW